MVVCGKLKLSEIRKIWGHGNPYEGADRQFYRDRLGFCEDFFVAVEASCDIADGHSKGAGLSVKIEGGQ